MDLKTYISSGILEQYVMDLLTAEQRIEVEAMFEKHPSLLEEMDKIESALYLYSKVKSIVPPPGLEQLILNEIAKEFDNDDSSEQGPPKSDDSTDLENEKSIEPEAEKPTDKPLKKGGENLDTPPNKDESSNKKGPGNWLWMLGLGTIGLLAAWMYFNNNNLKQEYSSLEEKFDELKTNCDSISENRDELESQLLFLRNSNSQNIPMTGTDVSPRSYATIYYNPAERKALLDINFLPEPPSDLQYQLWAIVDGKPVDMGVFDLFASSDSLKEVPFLENASAFAVTLEQKGGSPTPNMEQMYVYGAVSS